ncbi:MAG: hypothetical protein ACFFDT_36255 [Candidatus Hodarchaeota archaeon]
MANQLRFFKKNTIIRNSLLIFIFGFIIRSIPNLLTSYPIGYDTIDYATQILNWEYELQFPNLFFQTPLFILQADFIYLITNVDPFVIIRFFQPLLFGFLILSFYYASRQVCRWTPKWAFLGSIIFSMQTVTLRISWDLLRNEVGLSLLLLSLSHFKRPKSATYIILTILIGFAHQIVSFILLAIVTGLSLVHFWNRHYNKAKNLILSSIPFLLLFSLVLIYSLNQVDIGQQATSQSIFSATIISLPKEPSLPFPFINYLVGEGLADYQGSYFSLVLDVFTLYIASFLPLLPFLLHKVFYEPKLSHNVPLIPVNIWMIICTVPVINCLLIPSIAIFSWHRWMLMLVAPYTFYAVPQFAKLSSNHRLRGFRRIFLSLLVFVLGLSSLFYLIMPHTSPISSYAALNPSSKYSPVTMMRNTLTLDDVPYLRNVFTWLMKTTDKSSCLLVKDAFVDWAKILILTNITLINYRNQDVFDGIQYACALSYTDVYWVWWDNGIGVQWYGQEVPNYFMPVYQSNTIVIYKYVS